MTNLICLGWAAHHASSVSRKACFVVASHRPTAW